MALRQQVLLITMDLDDINAYRQEKGRDPIQWTTGAPDPCSDLLQQLDEATIGMLNHNGSPQLVKELFERVVQHPSGSWTTSLLNYRQRQLHYK